MILVCTKVFHFRHHVHDDITSHQIVRQRSYNVKLIEPANIYFNIVWTFISILVHSRRQAYVRRSASRFLVHTEPPLLSLLSRRLQYLHPDCSAVNSHLTEDSVGAETQRRPTKTNRQTACCKPRDVTESRRWSHWSRDPWRHQHDLLPVVRWWPELPDFLDVISPNAGDDVTA